jgi:expansin (peptidoglycan-binding protein)
MNDVPCVSRESAAEINPEPGRRASSRRVESCCVLRLLALASAASLLLPCPACSSGSTSDSAQAVGGSSSTGVASSGTASGGSTRATSSAFASNGGSAFGGAATARSGGSTTMPGNGGTTARTTQSVGGTVSAGGTVSVGGGVATATIPSGLPASCSDACNAATLADPKLTDYGALGNVTMYSTEASNGGACLYGATKVMYFAAINVNLASGDGKGQWQNGTICGQCIEVTILTSDGPKPVVVRIMDKCPDGFCGVDLGGSAPAAVMVDGMGRYEGAWRYVSCAGHPEVFDGSPSLHVKDGANASWSAIQVRNPTMAVSGIEWQKEGDANSKGAFSLASPSIENYYFVPVEVLQAGRTFVLTVRYRDGSTATATLSSGQLAQAEATYPLE